jgi:hypothetical protein
MAIMPRETKLTEREKGQIEAFREAGKIECCSKIEIQSKNFGV